MLENNQNFYTWAGLGILAVILGGYFILTTYTNDLNEFGSNVTTPRKQLNEDETGFGPELQPSGGYQATRDQYIDRRIQIENCILTPNSMTYKNGTKLMLDNRSADPLEIMIDGQRIRFDSYEYKIFTFYKNQTPHTIDIDCVTQDMPAYNVGRILLQA